MADGDAEVSHRVLTLELVRVTERTAMAAAAVRGRGDEQLADAAAVEAMWGELNRLNLRGRIVVGAGERGQAAKLYDGEEVGTGTGPEVDIAADPLDGHTLCAKNLPNSLTAIAVTPRGGLLDAPDIYMDKIAIGPGLPTNLIDLDTPPDEAIRRLAKAKGVRPDEISACILDRPRHAALIEKVRSTGASVRLIGDGDVSGIIHTTEAATTGIDIYLGSGGAPEGVIAAAALRCIGGQMLGRLIADSEEKRTKAERHGVGDLSRIYRAEDMASGDVLFAATGITDGSLLAGVRFGRDTATTFSIVTRSRTGTQRWIRAKHHLGEKSASAH
jgi:fructose-1,6-bisphosphatase II / sedoheptulose-1,7-bisphosphatase